MKVYTGIGVVVFIMFASSQQDIVCNKRAMSWQSSMLECVGAGGTPVLNNILDNLAIDTKKDVWTADYAVDPTCPPYNMLCGFAYMTNIYDIREELYGACYRPKYYICRNSTLSSWEVLEDTWCGAKFECNITVSPAVLQRDNVILKPGYYWLSNHVNVTQKMFPAGDAPTVNAFRCGAYSTGIGQYFRNCSSPIKSLCRLEQTHANYDKSCIVSNADTTDVSTTSFATHHEHSITSRKPDGKGKDKDASVTIGVAIGVGLVLVSGVVLAICLMRRFKCCKKEHINSELFKAAHQDDGKVTKAQRVHSNRSCEAGEHIHIHVVPNTRGQKESVISKSPVNRQEPSVRAVYNHTNVRHKSPQHNTHVGNRDDNNPQTGANLNYDTTVNIVRAGCNTNHKNQQTEANLDYDTTVTKSRTRENRDYTNTQTKTNLDYDKTVTMTRTVTRDNAYDVMLCGNYDSTTPITSVDKVDNVYDRMQNKVNDTVYDSTMKENDARQTDNVYNTLTDAGPKDDQHYYTTQAVNRSPKFTDNVYGIIPNHVNDTLYDSTTKENDTIQTDNVYNKITDAGPIDGQTMSVTRHSE